MKNWKMAAALIAACSMTVAAAGCVMADETEGFDFSHRMSIWSGIR